LPGKEIRRHHGTGHDKHTMHCIQNVCPLSRPSEARSSIIYSNVRYGVRSMTSEVRTDLSSASLVGTGQVPGSRVIARKKLYAHRPNDKANMRWANACDSVSIYWVLVKRMVYRRKLTLQWPCCPSECNPDHRAKYDTGEVGARSDALGICRSVQ
jgi:hypothetical protein